MTQIRDDQCCPKQSQSEMLLFDDGGLNSSVSGHGDPGQAGE